MIIGDPAQFAIESTIAKAYSKLGYLALGMFVLSVGSNRYGVSYPQAAFLACAADSVKARIDRRGQHVAAFADAADPLSLANAFNESIFEDETAESYFGLSPEAFKEAIYSNGIWWSAGDEEFDDGSYVLQFDVGNAVRLIAFKHLDDGGISKTTLTDVRMPSAQFYSILGRWHAEFLATWASLPKETMCE